MFIWERIPTSTPLEKLISELNARLMALRVLLRGVRRDGTAFRVENLIRSDEGLLLVAQSATPPTPAAGQAVLFLQDNGAGKMQWATVYPGGAVNVIDTEP